MKHAIAAIATAALLAAVPARAELRASAPYETKLTCAIYNALLIAVYDGEGEDEAVRKQAEEDGERWSELLVADAGGDEEKAMADVKARLDAVMAEMGSASQDEQMSLLFRKLEQMHDLCEPYET